MQERRSAGVSAVYLKAGGAAAKPGGAVALRRQPKASARHGAASSPNANLRSDAIQGAATSVQTADHGGADFRPRAKVRYRLVMAKDIHSMEPSTGASPSQFWTAFSFPPADERPSQDWDSLQRTIGLPRTPAGCLGHRRALVQ